MMHIMILSDMYCDVLIPATRDLYVSDSSLLIISIISTLLIINNVNCRYCTY